MSIDETALAAEFLRRHGVTTIERLARIGIGRRSVDTLARQQRVRRPGHGVVVSNSWPNTLEHRMALACALTGGVVKFPTAGEVWGLRKTPRSPDVHIWLPESRRIRRQAGVHVHYTTHLPPSDVVRRPDGIVVTSPPRTAFGSAAHLGHDDLESLVEHGMDSGYFVIPTLRRLSDVAGQHGRPGSARFAVVLAARPAWRRPPRSDHELRLERAMHQRGFPPMVREPRVVLHDGEVIHSDLGLLEHGFFVEVDHLTGHSRRTTSANDRRRDLPQGANERPPRRTGLRYRPRHRPSTHRRGLVVSMAAARIPSDECSAPNRW